MSALLNEVAANLGRFEIADAARDEVHIIQVAHAPTSTGHAGAARSKAAQRASDVPLDYVTGDEVFNGIGPGRDVWLDYAKAIGIILVVYGHVAHGVFAAGLNIDRVTFEIVESVIYSFHMPLFFFLSGVFLLPSMAKRSPKSFLLTKVDTILYPYVIWSLLQGAIEVVLSHYTNGHVTITEVLSFAWMPRAQFWFLYVLFFVFALALLIYRRSNSEGWSAGVFVGSILLFFIGGMLPGVYLISMLAHNFVYFSLGTLAAFRLRNLYGDWLVSLLGVVVLFVLSQWFFQVLQGFRYGSNAPAVSLLLAIIGIGLIVVISKWLAKFNLPLLAYLGRHSMTIYLVHVLAGSGCRIILQKFLGVTDVGIHLLLGTLAGLLLPLLFYWWCSRIGLGVLFSPPKLIQLGRQFNNRPAESESSM
jgi:fucose 4-O-acetylase-like acetyltransferase